MAAAAWPLAQKQSLGLWAQSYGEFIGKLETELDSQIAPQRLWNIQLVGAKRMIQTETYLGIACRSEVRGCAQVFTFPYLQTELY